MATAARRAPLHSRALPLHLPAAISPLKRSTSTKRPRSPDAAPGPQIAAAKRVKPVNAQGIPDEERARRRAQKEAEKEEFKLKYTKAFPSWSFFFDIDARDLETSTKKDVIVKKIGKLGGTVEGFFSGDVTHLVTDRPIPDGKENDKARTSQLKVAGPSKSPVKRSRNAIDTRTGQGAVFDLIERASALGMKIWSIAKMESVLDRCLDFGPSTSQVALTADAQKHQLATLLDFERVHRTTSERDPREKRHDFHYFSKNSYFVLVEDIRQELATIIAAEYPITRSKDGSEHGEWPVLYCHPGARGPFVPYDEKEARRMEKSLAQEAEERRERERREERTRQRFLQTNRRGAAQSAAGERRGADLRRTVSMANLHRRVSLPNPGEDLVDLEDDRESAKASGYLVSGGTTGTYVAASGNSVSVTSTTGTTSNTCTLKNSRLPSALQDKMQQQVLTRKAVAGTGVRKHSGTMGPPEAIPNRPPTLLRKSRSTNTMRLPKRNEATKPGYCESCRIKFKDFREHVVSRKHLTFAHNDSNFAELDTVLSRVQRRTLDEVEAQQRDLERRMHLRESSFDYSEGDGDRPIGLSSEGLQSAGGHIDLGGDDFDEDGDENGSVSENAMEL